MESINVNMQQTRQAGLNQVVTDKVNRMLDNNKSKALASLERLQAENRISKDFIAPIGTENNYNPIITFDYDLGLKMLTPNGKYNLHQNAIGQLATKLNIPTRYLKDIADGEPWQNDLAAHILNEHSNNTLRKRVLIRSVGDEVRGVLSDSYRRLSSIKLLFAFTSMAMENGAVLSDAYMNDTNIWAETIMPQPINVPTPNNGNVIVYMGARFSTSDYGNGAVDIRTFFMNGVCLNGMVRKSIMNQVHLGSKLPDNIALSEETYEYDTKTTVSAIKDLTKGLYSRDAFLKTANEIQKASETSVDFGRELTRLVSSGNLLKNEKNNIEELLMNGRSEDGLYGDSSIWKLTQAITAHGREVSPERSRELQEISGLLLDKVG